MCLKLFFKKKSCCDIKLFIFSVSCKTYNLKPIKKCRRNSIQHICSGYKHYIRKIKWNIKIMIGKCIILLRIKCFKKCCRRISSIICSNLINFIQHKDRVFSTGIFHSLNNSTRECPYIRPPVSSYFCLISNSTE